MKIKDFDPSRMMATAMTLGEAIDEAVISVFDHPELDPNANGYKITYQDDRGWEKTEWVTKEEYDSLVDQYKNSLKGILRDVAAYLTDSVVGKLIINQGEEMFLEPIYKYKVGDKVCCKDIYGSDETYVYTIKSQVNYAGKPYYKFKEGLDSEILNEEKLTPHIVPEFKFKVGDLVVKGSEVYQVKYRTRCNGRPSYMVDSPNHGQLPFNAVQDDLQPFPGKFRKDELVRCALGLSKGKLFRITKVQMVLGEPSYEVESLDGSTRCGFFETSLEKVVLKVIFKEEGQEFVTNGFISKEEFDSVFGSFKIKPLEAVSTETVVETPVKIWDDLNGKKIEGCFIEDETSEIEDVVCNECDESEKNIAATEKVCKSMLAMAQISQLLEHYGGPISDEEWLDESKRKYCVERFHGELKEVSFQTTYHFIAFHTEDQLDDFMSHPENLQLLYDYFMLDNNEGQEE